MDRIFGFVICLSVVLVDTQCESIIDVNGYVINKADGHGYKIIYNSRSWYLAKENCEKWGAKLAVPKTEEQFTFLQNVVKQMHYPSIVGTNHKLLVWIGIHNIEDYRVWKNIDGENINETGFHTWAGLHNGLPYSDDPVQPHCVVIDGMNRGFREFWCHRRQPYICQIQSQQTEDNTRDSE